MYMTEVQSQLADAQVYKLSNGDPTMKFKQYVDELIEEAYTLNVISADVKKTLTNDHPRTPILYLVPKVHKDLPHPPGRPIVSGVGSLFQPLATYVDNHLQQIVCHLPYGLKDITEFLTHIEHRDET